MQLDKLRSVATNYPYLQGLWVIPMGSLMILVGISNLQRPPSTPLLLALAIGVMALNWAATVRIVRHYSDTYGRVTPTRGRQVRKYLALAAFAAVLAVVAYTFWSPDGPRCVYAAAFALGILAYYAILVGLRLHQIVLWGAVCVLGLLPIWGGVGADRDALAMIPLGIALMVSGLLDQRLLARSFDIAKGLHAERGHAGG